ncbi:MAG: rod shape-determining protein MreD [Candidatus Thermofonsia Clade 1 bacterium]|uniref:Rod shape-determining protein MreD n=1 Tax=Candidatus Thermofonsia Clade 1 bacterium TaxID=2364210 RepID=A0A2M8PY15_9CHLR|nr:MAG: rod shape-determining protein MreD [Candidatus Thermofonsia Clade 1 bacterium]PJF42451.1 MAG: rod shape-determining protein MreD [Candidatus Thermofonsia Clade 1 bacterium]RMF51833.1 MAG: rod shape-determining protein MreD [Chloroflexota bacterium]
MGRYFSLSIVLIGALMQATIVPEVRIGESAPDLVLLLAVSWTLLAGLSEGLLWASAGGLLQDWLSGLPSGTTALALLAAAMSVNLLAGQRTRRNLLLAALLAAPSTFIYHGALIALLLIIRRPVEIGYTLQYITLTNALFNTAAMPLIFFGLGRLYAAFYPKRVRL